MEIYSTIIKNTDTPEVQGILSKLDSEKDYFLTSENNGIIEVQYIEPINNIKTIGQIPDEVVTEIKEQFGDKVNINISDYTIVYEGGIYSLVVDIRVDEVNERIKNKSLPLPLLIIVGFGIGVLTAVLVILKLILKLRKKK